MKTYNQIACVTGGSGMIGRGIVKTLKDVGYMIRILSRKERPNREGVEFVKGGINDNTVLKRFLSGAGLLFHCAGELYDKAQMNLVNVKGTELLIENAKAAGIEYFCHISSAGVVGKTGKKWVDERVGCQPQNAYERSKHLAERAVKDGIDGCRVVILRPTNVVDKDHPGALRIITEGTLQSRLKLLLIGGECSHIIHADNVAAAAIHFINLPLDRPECYFVSCDHEPGIKFADLCYRYNQLSNSKIDRNRAKPIHLPIIVPYLFRKLRRGTGNMGDVRYSAEKLIRTGFQFPVDIEGTLHRLMASVN